MNETGWLQEILDAFGILSDIIQDFYDKLLKGELSNAKETKQAIGRELNTLKVLISKHSFLLEKQTLDAANDAVNTLFNILVSELDPKINDALAGLTERVFAQDSETYKELFIGEFYEVVKRMKTIANDAKNVIVAKKAERSVKSTESYIPQDATIIKEKKYADVKNSKGPKFKEIAEKVEVKIQTYPQMNTLHEPIKTGLWEKHLHARMYGDYGDYRIVYWWDPKNKLLTYRTIGTHKELGIN